MARYTEAVCRLCRREGQKLYLKGQRCYSEKCAVEKKPYPPGQAGDSGGRRRRPSDYGMQLREKQKMRYIYGLFERQFRVLVREAKRQDGVTGEVLMQLLERRLDNVIFRAGLAGSRAQARQMVTHGFFQVNDRRTDVASFRVRIGDVITVDPKGRKSKPLTELSSLGGRPVPDWIEVDVANLTLKIVALPTRDQIDTEIEEQQVVEFYSR